MFVSMNPGAKGVHGDPIRGKVLRDTHHPVA
jgi:hypothetical protein